jgi:membrane-bound lytic murein transglycosylase B
MTLERLSRSKQTIKYVCASLFMALSVWTPQHAWAEEPSTPIVKPSFEDWLSIVLDQAKGRGLTSKTVQTALSNVTPNPRVVELDRQQPEFTQTFWAYLDGRVSSNRIERGRKLLAQNKTLLAGIEKKYGVQGRFLVAFWGLETNFGQFLGGFPVIESLATLAYDDRRSEFFRAELFDALKILEQDHVDLENMVGSWAGAMGQPQFMPSTFSRYAIDEDGDGRKDIWASLPDVFGSASNYLSGLGWDNTYTWGREVRLPADFNLDLAALRTKKPLPSWQDLGVHRIDGRALPNADIQASVILPAGHKGPAFLVYDNFEAILNWNRSLLYAISVGHLADRLIGLGPLKSPRREERPLSRDQVTELQERLNALGYDAGEPDGQAGPRTRAAVRAFQKATELPADGYTDKPVYEAVIKAATETDAPR